MPTPACSVGGIGMCCEPLKRDRPISAALCACAALAQAADKGAARRIPEPA